MHPAELEHARAVPRRDVLEGFVGDARDALVLDVRVVVVHVDELRAAVVRGGGDCPRELFVADIRTDVDNVPSQRVAERADFVREGIERSARFNPRRGCRVDFVVYSRLPSD